MSLIFSLSTSFAGLRNTEAQLSVASSNVTNADKTGYTRKSYEADYITTSAGTVPVDGTTVTANYDEYLYKAMISDSSESGYYEIFSDYLSNYADRLGETGEDSTLNSALDDLAASLDSLTQTPEDSSLKSEVVRNAELLTYEIRSLSSSVQDLRAQADQDIALAVNEINQSLEKLEKLNEQIARAEATDQSTADLEDERRVELEAVSSYLDVDYFIDSNNQLKIYTGGRALLDSKAHTLSYTQANIVNSSVTYPGGFSAIELNGVDITSSITSGKVGALLELRDTTLVEEQAKLDEFATVLMDEMNALLNSGASLPARSEITGELQGLSGTDPVSATGSVRISTVDENGEILSVADIDLSSAVTLDDIVASINSALGPDVTASITASGELQLVANNSGEGLALNQLDSDIGGTSFSNYFGLNNMFTGTGAENIYVSDYLRDNADYLATSSLSATAVVGDAGINAGDSTLTEEMQNLFSASVSFSAAGNFGAQSSSLDRYVDKIMSDIASRADNASEEYSTVNILYEQTKTSLQNLSGVNIDEEMAQIVELESKYEAGATLIATIQDMFSELIAAVR